MPRIQNSSHGHISVPPNICLFSTAIAAIAAGSLACSYPILVEQLLMSIVAKRPTEMPSAADDTDSIRNELGDQSSFDDYQFALWRSPQFGGWSYLLLMLAHSLHFVSLLPSRSRLVRLHSSRYTTAIRILSVTGIVCYGLTTFNLFLDYGDLPYLLRNMMSSDAGIRPAELVSLHFKIAKWTVISQIVFAVFLVFTIAFHVNYLWRFRKASSARIFMSYRRADTGPVVRRIGDRIIGRFGDGAIFRDEVSIPGGTDFPNQIQSALSTCHIVLAIIGNRWMKSPPKDDWIEVELETARKNNIIIIPVLIDDAIMPTASEMPQSIGWITAINAITVRQDADFDRDLEKLFEVAQSLID